MNVETGRTTVGVVILGAGASTRMGGPKLLLPWGATTVLGHLLEQWGRLAVAQVAIVLAAGARAVAGELDRLGVDPGWRITNPHPGQGMFSSVRCAARWAGWKPDLTHWVIALGDQPHLRAETLQALLDYGRAHPQQICQPARNGRARHPVWLPKALFAQLADAPAASLKQFLAACGVAVARFESADPGLDLDLDTPAEYARARQLVDRPSVDR
ncbi:MAG: nucleotidyltransferase family protein [Verrucomicrobia bacterium]|nr:nucleotidyltransferase family protein [Verrucomicrobiota bacterium]